MNDLLIKPHEFAEAGVFTVESGRTIRQMLQQAAGSLELPAGLVVRVGGHLAPEAYWDRLRPKAGVAITVVRTDLAGGGTARQLLATAVMLVVSYYAPGWGAAITNTALGSAAATAVSAGIVIAASYAANALIRVPTAAGSSGSADQKQWNQLTGSSNQINPWGPIPLILGEHRFFPPHAAMPYSEMVGENSFQHCIFDLGYGGLFVDDFKIGDDDIANFDVSYELTDEDTPTTLYTNDVSEDAVSSAMNTDGDQVTRTSAPGVDSIGLDILLPQGLMVFGDSMTRGWPMWILWRIEYRPVGSGTWLTPNAARLSGMTSSWAAGGDELPATAPAPGLYLVKNQTRNPYSVGLSWDVANGQYEVRITRVDTKNQTTRSWADQATWLSLRSITHTSPSTTGTCKVAMRIRATDQLTGTLQTMSCRVQQSVRVYNRGTGTWSWQYSRNPAWIAYWLMTQSRAVARRVPESRMDLASFADFADFCTANGFEARMVVDTQMTAADLIRKILAGALGDLGNRDGKYCVVFDRNDPMPVLPFTPQETQGFKASRAFVKIPHALRVQFKNPEADWQDDEIVVVRDGYSYRGKDARGNSSTDPVATEFETLNLQQTVLPKQAWKVGRYHFAQALYRPNTYEWSSDIAGLSVSRGDCVQVPNDVTEWGAGWGRVLQIVAGGVAGAAATVTLDNDIATDAGKAYRMQIRKASGEVSVVNLVAAGGETNVFAIDALPAGVGGAVAVVGETAVEIQTLLVTGVKYTADLGTQFTATDYDARVAPYWADAPDSIVSEVTGKDYGLPDPPNVTVVVSSPVNDATDDAGVSRSIVRMGVKENSGIYRIQAR